jgi:para-nitrobenzyl esterase
MFGTLPRSWRPKRPADYALSDRMITYWCNFMKTGNPNSSSLPRWEPCAASTPFVIDLHED